jgi:glycosyltransferase involved in cell wall biosynthesis
MWVALDARVLGSGLGGDETMLRGFLRGINACAADDDRFVVLLPVGATLPDEVAASPHFVVRPVRRLPGALHFAFGLPRELGALDPRPEAVFSVTHAPAWGAVPTAIMINDISPLRDPAWYPARTRIRLRTAFRYQIPRAKVVLTVSEFCKREILSEFPLDSDSVFVVPNTIDPPRPISDCEQQACAAWLRASGVERPFVLYLGNLHPRKNVPRLIRAFDRAARESAEVAECQLVVAGARWWGEGEERELAHAAPGSVVMLGRVDDVQREYLLRTSRAMAYLSLYEGFGLPPVEAMARGTPVLAADRAALPEVTGGAAVLVDPLDVDAIASGLIKVVGDGELREELRVRGHEQAARFSAGANGARAIAALAAATAASP